MPPMQFAFITATTPAEWKSKTNVTAMRSAVMHEYLERARDDPTTTDRRALKKRVMDVPRRLLGRSKGVKSPPDEQAMRRDFAVDLRQQQTPQAPPSIDPSIYAPTLSDLTSMPALSEGSESASTSRSSPTIDYHDQNPIYGCTTALMPEASDLGVEMERYFEDFHRARRVSIPTPIEMEWLRMQCLKYFATKGKLLKWMPFQISSPLAYLSRLCVAAPYNDIMASQSSPLDSVPFVHLRMTMEIFDVLPRAINDALDDPVQRDSDASIVAIIQMFYGQLSTPYLGLVGSHQAALKRMVGSRGGLGRLDEGGVIAASLTMLDFEANFLRGLPTGGMYHEWTAGYLEVGRRLGCPSPDGPLFVANEDMRCIAASPLCAPRTLEVVRVARSLTLVVLRLRRVEILAGQTGLDAIRSYKQERAVLHAQLRQICGDLHRFPSELSGISDAHLSAVYTAIRAATLLYAHAIQHRTSLQSNIVCHACEAPVTAETIYEAVRTTSLGDCWGHLAGVLYWTLIVAAAACHPAQTAKPPSLPFWSFDNSSTTADHNSDAIRLSTIHNLLVPPTEEQEACNIFSTTPLVTPPDLSAIPPIMFQKEAQTLTKAKELFDSYACPRSTEENARESATRAHHASLGREGQEGTWVRRTGRRHPSGDAGEKQVVRQEYVRRYLTANAMRVSFLLRFEHEAAMIRSVAALAEVRTWLDGS
ncbi:hypothetical protein KVT40_001618 [Elsinoe batatas]|uniref:Uncharacterized protein n=1 Tax=Elsinoe batatas TaxID=2601811 RepID=A0A8K0PLJ0_9PEZI|nr:hypothetical protein KVT40_001618 [Elsinoe batatas]